MARVRRRGAIRLLRLLSGRRGGGGVRDAVRRVQMMRIDVGEIGSRGAGAAHAAAAVDAVWTARAERRGHVGGRDGLISATNLLIGDGLECVCVLLTVSGSLPPLTLLHGAPALVDVEAGLEFVGGRTNCASAVAASG